VPAHLRLLLLTFSHFSAEEPHNQSSATRRTTWKKIALVPARTRPKFCHILLLVQTPNPLVQALETKKKNKLFNETNLSPTFFC